MDATQRTTRRPRLWPILLVFLATLLLAACASAAAPFTKSGDGTTGDQGAAVEGGPLPAGTAAPQPARDEGTTSTDQQAAAPNVDETLLVKTGSLELEVADVDTTLVKARTLIAGFGGYVSGSQQSLQGDQPMASITYRIPAARWDDAVAALRGLGDKVLGEKTEAVEVTGQVLDLGARIDNLRATERQLQAIMLKATKISDILDVQQQLTSVQGQIEELSTEKAHLEAQAAYGTLTVGFQAPLVPVTTTVTKDWSLGEQVDKALAVLVQVGQGLATAAVWFVIVLLPFLLAGLLALGILLVIGRRITRRPTGGGPFEPSAGPSAPTA